MAKARKKRKKSDVEVTAAASVANQNVSARGRSAQRAYRRGERQIEKIAGTAQDAYIKAGHAGEVLIETTLNANARMAGKGVKAVSGTAGGFPTHQADDIRVYSDNQPRRAAQVKVSREARTSAKRQVNAKYGDNLRLIPTDQLAEGQATLRARAKNNARSSSPRRRALAEEQERTVDLLTDHIEVDGIKSDAWTYDDAAKAGQGDTAYLGRKRLGAKVKTRAQNGLIGGGIAAAAESINQMQAIRARETAVQDAAVEIGKAAAKSAAQSVVVAETEEQLINFVARSSPKLASKLGKSNIVAPAIMLGVTLFQHGRRGNLTFRKAGAETVRSTAATAGAMAGGAGLSFIPFVGTIAGSLAGGWLGSKVGDLLASTFDD